MAHQYLPKILHAPSPLQKKKSPPLPPPTYLMYDPLFTKLDNVPSNFGLKPSDIWEYHFISVYI